MGTAGALCIRHDLPVLGPFPRGRPYVLVAAATHLAARTARSPELLVVGARQS
jgi:hypothetical protein